MMPLLRSTASRRSRGQHVGSDSQRKEEWKPRCGCMHVCMFACICLRACVYVLGEGVICLLTFLEAY